MHFISGVVRRSITSVHNSITALKSSKSINRSAPKLGITERQQRAIVRTASNGTRTARKMRDTYNSKGTVRLIQQVLPNALDLN